MSHFLLSQCRPTDVIVVILGGASLEEAYVVSELNKANTGTRIILGGSSIVNSTMYTRGYIDVNSFSQVLKELNLFVSMKTIIAPIFS